MNSKRYAVILGMVLWLLSDTIFSASAQLTPSGLELTDQKKEDTQSKTFFDKIQREIRNGEEKNARSTIDKWASSCSQPDQYYLFTTANFLIEHHDWQVTKYFLEKFPQSAPAWPDAFIQQWYSEGSDNSSKYDEIDSWIKERAKVNKSYWTKRRYGLACKAGRKQQFLDELKKDIQNNSTDLATARSYISICSEICSDSRNRRLERLHKENSDRPKLDWITNVVQPDAAFDNYRFAQALQPDYPNEAIFYLQRALAVKFTVSDNIAMSEEMSKLAFAMPTSDSLLGWQSAFNDRVKTALAECYKRTGKNTEAQALSADLPQDSVKSGFLSALPEMTVNKPGFGYMKNLSPTGEIRSLNPVDIVKLKENESQLEKDRTFQYWRNRANQLRDEKGSAAHHEALDKELQLSVLPIKPSKEQIQIRYWAISDYAHFLMVQEGPKSALAFLWHEYDSTSDADFKKKVMGLIIFSRSEQPPSFHAKLSTSSSHDRAIYDERLWTFLKDKSEWNYGEERLLWDMFKGTEDPAFWQRATKLALGNASRELAVGWTMNRCREYKLSIPLLKDACLHNKSDKQNTAYLTLFESYMAIDDWKNAEKIWPHLGAEVKDKSGARYLAALAIAAARNGDKHDALRFWQRKDETDFASLKQLDTLAKLGMKADLVKYYTAAQKRRPTSTVPADALNRLSRI